MKPGLIIYCVLAGSLLLANSRTTAEDQVAALSVNPFERPAWVSDARAAPAGDRSVQRRVPIDLRATLVSGKGSLANVGGRIIGVGEKFNGYRLLSVEEGKAVFSNDDEIIRVSVVSDDEGEDDET